MLDEVIRSNVHGTYLVCREFGRGMMAQRAGRIVTVSSMYVVAGSSSVTPASITARFLRSRLGSGFYYPVLGSKWIFNLFGETGYTTLERVWARPTFEVNGLLSGFTGEGAKTVLPAVAMAKVSMRLVPDQHPNKIADLFEAYLKKVCPKTVEVKVTRMHGGKPWMAEFDNKFVRAAGRAIGFV